MIRPAATGDPETPASGSGSRDLIKRVTTVSVETMKIVDGLPPLWEAR